MFKTKKKSESGITLITLIVTIVILIVLSAVVIRGITGEGLIKTSETAAEDYAKGTYEEQLKQKVRATILSYAAEGKEAGLAEIAESLREETEWVKAVEANTNEDLGNEDIVVITIDGHVYQIYYDNIYGLVYIEYLGKEDGKAYPTVKARYEAENGNILVEAKTEAGSIAKIELISRVETVGNPIENPAGEVSFNVKEKGTGWYKIKVVTNEGKIRYAWVKKINIKDTLTKPIIEVETESKEVNGWYGGDGKDLYVVISTDNPYAKEIHYTLTGANETEEEVVKKLTETEKSVRIKLENSGITRVVGAIEDGEGNSSNYSIENIRYDKELPVITSIEKTGAKGEGDWYIENVELKIITEDQTAGYNYTVYDKEGNTIKEKTKVESVSTPLRIERDGEYKIEIELEDKAGNKSEVIAEEIKKDTERPILQEVRIDQGTIEETSFKIGIAAKDETSGIAYYEYYLNGNKQEPDKDTSATHVCEGLTAGTEYKVKVIVYDNAGLSIESAEIPVTTAKEGSSSGEGLVGTVLQFIDGPRSVEEEKTNEKIKLTMTAISNEGDTLTYTIKYGKYNADGEKALGTKIIPDVPQGNTAEVEITELENYTRYYFDVECTSSSSKTIFTTCAVRTFCLASACSGPEGEYLKCPTCKR